MPKGSNKKKLCVLQAFPDVNRDALVGALNAKFPQMKFTLEGNELHAEGPWDLPASARPAWGTMQTYAEAYVQAIIDLSTCLPDTEG